MMMKRPRATRDPWKSAAPYPRMGTCTTRAPHRSAISTEPSEEPLSATMTSPSQAAIRNQCCAFRTHVSNVAASFRHGITMETSHARVMVAATESSGVVFADFSTGCVTTLVCIDSTGMQAPGR